ncbi:MAG: Ni,Fe-hydrogenase III large subunit [Halothiobacillus sp. 13-55-253]|jgi:Ni,Fe-hydrogenase III large subunit|nr:MAG: Ni,Fe-hydrogenase III large subunit [Halothiobacillus sp. 13-55-253]
MSRFDWLPGFIATLAEERVAILHSDPNRLAPAHCLLLDAEDWGGGARVASASGFRWAGLWGDQIGDRLRIYTVLAHNGDYLVLMTEVSLQSPVLASHTPYFPAANRLERHLHDLLGVNFKEHPDARRWTRHCAWAEDVYPLRSDFPVGGNSTKQRSSDVGYPFERILGNGVNEIPLGPVHGDITEPGHFRFQAAGEEVLSLEARLGYTHKGIEKIAVGRDASGLARLAGRVSGDSTVAHTWAACMAMERAAGVDVPPRALHLRALFAECERIANHLNDIGGICNTVGFAFAQQQFGRLREQLLRTNLTAFGHRLLMDVIMPGGVYRDLPVQWESIITPQLSTLSRELEDLLDIIDDHSSLKDRLIDTGSLNAEMAQMLGVTGYVGKASGQDFDVRRDHGYAPYDGLEMQSPCRTQGDVAARLQIRADEIRASLNLIDRLIYSLPIGPIAADWPQSVHSSEGLAVVEGWRGEIISFIRFDEDGRVARFFPLDPSWFSLPALEHLVLGNNLPDFAICNKSVNISYSGQDL